MPALPERDPPAEPHVWAPEPWGDPDAPFDRFGHALLRDIRDRKPPRDRLRLGFALFLAIAFQVGLVVLLRLEMRPRYVAPADTERNAIQVSFFAPPSQPSAAPAAPQIAPPPPLATPPPRLHHIEPHRPNAMTATIGPPPPALHVYGKNGQVLLPPASSVAATPDYKAPQPQEPSLMKHTTPLPYHSTQFSKDWAPENESLGAKAFRRAAEATTKEKTIRLPGGMKIKCAISPLLIAAGCGPEPPPPPPKNDNDIRLSLPPPVTLTGKKVDLPAAPSTSALPAKASTAQKPGGKQ
ncbi:MAG TPA: hypothetical protein VFH71_00010 [Rhodanobacteraceae bacterium]|nr:hypothetical protein [Rhodanobacteraceae bacterium]